MSGLLPDSKRELRGIYRSIDYPFSPDLSSLPEFIKAESVFCFVSMPEEVDTRPVLKLALGLGKRLSVPLCLRGGIMQARIITSLSELEEGFYGIESPPENSPEELCPELTIVPALAFDREGYRLGRGGGYYDRWLSRRDGKTIGLGREAALADKLPRDVHDVPVDMLLTEKGLYRFKR